jgi:hypothetical protein
MVKGNEPFIDESWATLIDSRLPFPLVEAKTLLQYQR